VPRPHHPLHPLLRRLASIISIVEIKHVRQKIRKALKIMFSTYLLGSALNLLDVSLQVLSDILVVVDLFQLKEVF
jgi:hypothetical protein